MTDPLDKIIVDEESPNLEVLANSVNGCIRISKQGTILYDKKFYMLPKTKKIVLYLLSRKIISIKNLKADFSEGIKSKDISEEIGIKYGYVRKTLSSNLKELVKNEKGKWFIPNYNLYKCRSIIKNDNSE